MTTIAPWLLVADGAAAVDFYRRALGAEVLESVEDGGVVMVANLSVAGAPFWLQQDEESAGGAPSPVRMIVSADDPDAAFARAVSAGADVVAGMHEDHGWRTGRVEDPFGYHWEFARTTGD